jgi:hypothetical protein
MLQWCYSGDTVVYGGVTVVLLVQKPHSLLDDHDMLFSLPKAADNHINTIGVTHDKRDSWPDVHN